MTSALAVFEVCVSKGESGATARGGRQLKLDFLSQKWDITPWLGSSKRDFLEFPAPVKGEMGNALGIAQFGGKHPAAKPWKGQGAGVFEIVEHHDGNTYRAVYTVRFPEVVYALHAFQKKSPKGIRTARSDVELIERRLKMAQRDYEVRYGTSKI